MYWNMFMEDRLLMKSAEDDRFFSTLRAKACARRRFTTSTIMGTADSLRLASTLPHQIRPTSHRQYDKIYL